MTKIPFIKPPLSIEEQINLLKSRGLIIRDFDLARHSLTHISYYRLSGYGKLYKNGIENNNEGYHPQTTFEDVLSLYNFDRKLRLVVMDALERIEVSAKAVLSNSMSMRYGSHWYLNKKYFTSQFEHEQFLYRLKNETGFERNQKGTSKKQDPIFAHYYRKYSAPAMPSSWMVSEVLSLGTVSLIFERLVNQNDKKAIAEVFDASPWVLQSWLHSLTYIRNICAHHGRLYNRQFKITPVSISTYREHFKNMTTFYVQSVVIHLLLRKVVGPNKWSNSLQELFKEHPNVSIEAMGFVEGWYKDQFWL
jgi:abortive infection bacteriophage resistance protein